MSPTPPKASPPRTPMKGRPTSSSTWTSTESPSRRPERTSAMEARSRVASSSSAKTRAFSSTFFFISSSTSW
jgi:hypothetical protein